MNALNTVCRTARAVERTGRIRFRSFVLICLAMGLSTGAAFGTDTRVRQRDNDLAQRRDRRPERRARDRMQRPDRRNAATQGRDPMGAPPALWRRMTPAERERVMDFVHEQLPELAEHVSRGDGAFKPWMRRHIGEILEMMEMVEHDPERGALMIHERRLDIQLNRLARHYAKSREPEQRAQIEKEMTRACTEWVDLRHRRREMQIQELEQRLQTLRKRHERASEMRDQRIEFEVVKRLERAEGPINAIPKRD